MTHVRALPLDAATYSRHKTHAEDQLWVEKNCYIDIWLEVIHALGCEPLAVLPFTLAIDFEGDQWTFFKPPHGEIFDLYGIEVQELNVWRPLLDHAIEHLGAGKLISTESDAWWLPDTSGTDYRTRHSKTTIVLNEVDVERKLLGYFHNASYHTLTGEDFDRTFRVDVPRDPTFLPLFAEVLRVGKVVRRPQEELVAHSRVLWARHLARRPADNPIARFRTRFEKDLGWLTAEGLEFYHAWAFGTTRQLGSGAELVAMNLRWLAGAGDGGLDEAIAAFDAISGACKTFILKGARAVNAKRALDAGAMFEQMAAAWQRGTDALDAKFAAKSV